ncbi:MAG TPA: energy-coupling factor transporter transmembrane component T [Anaerolineae bacterium]|nr:energy-coupling factor transporter transmembrane component T [Anaerolineae bacterium]HQK14126.1 energy-coupling factor transporter transmembrane component T [Anaerolineae bacterium]
MSTLTLQTVERDSFFTHLDFRPKLFMMATITIVAFVWENPVMECLLTLAVMLACLAVGVKFSYIRKLVVIMLPFDILLIVTQGFFAEALIRSRTGQTALTPLFTFPAHWFWVGGASMSVEGVAYAMNVVFKTLTMTLVIPLGIFTTDVNTMIVGMVQARIPYKLAFIFSSTLRFFPLLFEEIQSIIEAQRLRGLAFETMGPVKRVRVYAKVAVPLILGAMVKSQMLEVVLQSKAFSGSPDRTYLHESRLGVGDYILFAFFALFFVAAIVAYFGWGIGRFGKPVFINWF